MNCGEWDGIRSVDNLQDRFDVQVSVDIDPATSHDDALLRLF